MWKERYETNTEFKEYVDKYATKHLISIEDALCHKLVHEFWNYLVERCKDEV